MNIPKRLVNTQEDIRTPDFYIHVITMPDAVSCPWVCKPLVTDQHLCWRLWVSRCHSLVAAFPAQVFQLQGLQEAQWRRPKPQREGEGYTWRTKSKVAVTQLIMKFVSYGMAKSKGHNRSPWASLLCKVHLQWPWPAGCCSNTHILPQ